MANCGLFDDEDEEDIKLFGARTTPNPLQLKPRPSASRSESGGHDANFVVPLREELTCPICRMALREPQLTDCGHHYCEVCLRPLLGSKHVIFCPICRTQLTRSKIYPNNALKRQILSLDIYCDQKEKGCKWSGELRDLETHKRTCQYIDVLCPNGCKSIILLADVKKHEEVCPNRIVTCFLCNLKIEHWSMESHLTECEKYVVLCPNNCGYEMTREKLDYHLSQQGSCPNTPVECEFKDAGCQFKGSRIATQEHISTGVVSHLGLVMSQLKEIKCQLKDVQMQLMREANQRMLLMSPGKVVFMWRISDWSEKMVEAKAGRCLEIESDKFYAGHLKYCLQLKACPNGMNVLSAGYVTLFLAPTPGKYDDQIQWPFGHSFSLSIVDQQSEGEDKMVNYSPPYKGFFDSPTSKGCGHPRFITHEDLSSLGHCFIKNDSIVFKVTISI